MVFGDCLCCGRGRDRARSEERGRSDSRERGKDKDTRKERDRGDGDRDGEALPAKKSDTGEDDKFRRNVSLGHIFVLCERLCVGMWL